MSESGSQDTISSQPDDSDKDKTFNPTECSPDSYLYVTNINSTTISLSKDRKSSMKDMFVNDDSEEEYDVYLTATTKSDLFRNSIKDYVGETNDNKQAKNILLKWGEGQRRPLFDVLAWLRYENCFEVATCKQDLNRISIASTSTVPEKQPEPAKEKDNISQRKRKFQMNTESLK